MAFDIRLFCFSISSTWNNFTLQSWRHAGNRYLTLCSRDNCCSPVCCASFTACLRGNTSICSKIDNGSDLIRIHCFLWDPIQGFELVLNLIPSWGSDQPIPTYVHDENWFQSISDFQNPVVWAQHNSFASRCFPAKYSMFIKYFILLKNKNNFPADCGLCWSGCELNQGSVIVIVTISYHGTTDSSDAMLCCCVF